MAVIKFYSYLYIKTEEEEISLQITTLFYLHDLINDQRCPQSFPVYLTQNGM